MANKPETIIFQTKCNHNCIYFDKYYRNNLGDCITLSAGTKLIPGVFANSTEYVNVNISYALLPLNCFLLTAFT